LLSQVFKLALTAYSNRDDCEAVYCSCHLFRISSKQFLDLVLAERFGHHIFLSQSIKHVFIGKQSH